MIDEKKQNGGIAGDIQQSRQRKAPVNNPQTGSSIAGVTETTNAQGNRSFTGRGGVAPGQPKPAKAPTPVRTGVVIPETGGAASGGGGGGGIMEGLNISSAGAPRPVVQNNPVVSAAKAEAGSGGIAAGMPGFNQLNKGASLPPSGVKPKPTIMDGWEASIPGQIVGAAKGRNPIPGTRAIYDATQERAPAISTAIDKGSYANAAGQTLGIATDAIQQNVGDLTNNALNTAGGIVDGLKEVGRGISGAGPTMPAGTAPGKPLTQSTQSTQKTSTPSPAGTQQAGGNPAPDQGAGTGITQGFTEEGRRAYSGRSVSAPGQINTIDMGITDAQRTGRSGVANPGFEKALAAGDYETALQSVNRSDASQMSRLGQLQGQLRQQRDLASAAAADRNYSGSTAASNRNRQATADAMIANAKRLSDRGFSKGALRNIQAANGAAAGSSDRGNTGIDGGLGFKPGEIDTFDEAAKAQADTDVAQAEATTARTVQQQQGILQGLIEQMNSPDITPVQRQSLTQRYQALAGGNAQDRYLMVDQPMGYDTEGKPVMGRVAIDPSTNRTYGGRGGMPSAGDAAADALAQIKAKPENEQLIRQMFARDYGMQLPEMGD